MVCVQDELENKALMSDSVESFGYAKKNRVSHQLVSFN